MLAAASLTHGARAEDDITLSGRLQTDVRFRPQQVYDYQPWYDPQHIKLGAGVARNMNLFKLRLHTEMGSVAAVADVDFLWLGVSDNVQTFADLTLRQQIDPYRLKAHAAYVHARDLFVPGLDVRLGQQLVNWGKGDQFNPTNNLNANDFEDPLAFGQQLANAMLRADYAPQGSWSLSAVWVPVFKPALLPPSAAVALADIGRLPVDNPAQRRHLVALQHQVPAARYPLLVPQVTPALPPASFDNMQYAVRAAWSAMNQDVALSYYYGRSDMPLPARSIIESGPGGTDPSNGASRVDGVLQPLVTLQYPRMQVIGINVAGEAPLLHYLSAQALPFGYHLELALISPQEVNNRIVSNVQLPGITFTQISEVARVIPATLFAKWNLGLDYTLLQRVYLNVQWVHGFIDEFGTGDFLRGGDVAIQSRLVTSGSLDGERDVEELVRPRLGDYLIVGGETKFINDTLLARLFVVYDLTTIRRQHFDPRSRRRVDERLSVFGQAASAIVFPEITYNVGGGLDLSLGALAKLGKTFTKFGDPAVGGTEVWMRARYSY